MKKYPAIYESVNGLKYIYVDNVNYFSFERDAWDESRLPDNHASDENITYGYLANTKIKIESKEHEKFVRSLIPDSLRSFWEYKGDSYLYLMTEMSTQDRCKEITIPMPPPMSKENPETEEWPQVGDEVSFPSGKGVLVVDKPDKNGIIIVKSTDEDSIDEYKKVSLNALKKPLTGEEELRDELINTTIKVMSDDSYDLTHNAYYLISGLMKIYDIKKKLK